MLYQIVSSTARSMGSLGENLSEGVIPEVIGSDYDGNSGHR